MTTCVSDSTGIYFSSLSTRAYELHRVFFLATFQMAQVAKKARQQAVVCFCDACFTDKPPHGVVCFPQMLRSHTTKNSWHKYGKLAAVKQKEYREQLLLLRSKAEARSVAYANAAAAGASANETAAAATTTTATATATATAAAAAAVEASTAETGGLFEDDTYELQDREDASGPDSPGSEDDDGLPDYRKP